MRAIAIIYKYHYYRVRVSVVHFSRDIMRLCWRVLACRACAMVCMYIDIDIVYSACVRAVLARAVGSVCCWSAFLLARSCRVVLCVRCSLLLYGVLVL